MKHMKRKKGLAALVCVAVAGAVLVAGCGGKTDRNPLVRAADDMFSREGLIKDSMMDKFIAMEGPSHEKIDIMLDMIENGPVKRHAAAARVLAKIDDPYKIDGLVNLIDTYDGPKDMKHVLTCWAITGLSLTFERKAYDKLFDMLANVEDPLILGAVLHDLGFAKINADRSGKKLPDGLFEEIEANVITMKDHDDLSVREHANRALERLNDPYGQRELF